jgi:hypothetical protein
MTRRQYIARLRQLREAIYSTLPPHEQRRVTQLKQARVDWIAWKTARGTGCPTI